MNYFKKIISVLVIASVLAIFAVSAAASLSYTTSVYWNANETAAWAVTEGTGPSSSHFYVKAVITSTSTGQTAVDYGDSNFSTSATAETGSVSVTYPSDIPLVTYDGFIKYGYAPVADG